MFVSMKELMVEQMIWRGEGWEVILGREFVKFDCKKYLLIKERNETKVKNI